MSRSSSVPRYKTYSIDSNNSINQDEYNKLQKKHLKSNFSELKRDMKNKEPLLYQNVSNAIKSLDNNLTDKLKKRNIIAQNKINSIQNNYYEIKHLLDNKINKLEKNQKKVLDFMKYSLEQDNLKLNSMFEKYNQNIKNHQEQSNQNREYLLKVVKEVPKMVQNKINQIYLGEIEENKRHNLFLNDLKNKIVSELKEQRRLDNLKYRQLISELNNAKDKEEKEKIKLIKKLNDLKYHNKIKPMNNNIPHNNNNLKNNQYPYNYNNNNIYPFYPNNNSFNNIYPYYPNNIYNNSLASFNLSLSVDELIKIYLLKYIMDKAGLKPDFYNLNKSALGNNLPNINSNKLPSHSYEGKIDFQNNKYNNNNNNKTLVSNKRYNSNSISNKNLPPITENKVNKTNNSLNKKSNIMSNNNNIKEITNSLKKKTNNSQQEKEKENTQNDINENKEKTVTINNNEKSKKTTSKINKSEQKEIKKSTQKNKSKGSKGTNKKSIEKQENNKVKTKTKSKKSEPKKSEEKKKDQKSKNSNSESIYVSDNDSEDKKK